METREEWLTDLAIDIVEHELGPHGYDVHRPNGIPILEKLRCSCSWPSSRGIARHARAIGQTYDPRSSTDGRIEVFITPWIDDPMLIAETMVHEMLHAHLGTEAAHGPEFKLCAKSVGLVGPATSTRAGSELKGRLQTILDGLGPYPHKRLLEEGMEKSPTRLIKVACTNVECPPYNAKRGTSTVARITQGWIELGGISCGICGAAMVVTNKDD